jgi:uncharacterized protein
MRALARAGKRVQGEGGVSEVSPVQKQDRILSLDVIRGFAVLGILAVNAQFFAAPWYSAVNPGLAPLGVNENTLWSWLVMHAAFEFKCITLFSMLFGVSIFLVGGERSDKERGKLLRSRLFWLLIFGLIHALLIWYGDILVHYALTGFLVMLARSWRARTLLIVGIVLYVLATAFQVAFTMLFNVLPAEKVDGIEAQMWSPPQEEIDRVVAAMQGGLASATLENISTWIQFAFNSVIGLMMRTAGVMMIGLALFKYGFLSGKAKVWVYWLFLALGAGAISFIAYGSWRAAQDGFDFVQMQTEGANVNTALSIFGSLGYASLFILLTLGGWRFITGPLSAVGRMAFTNYLTQSLIMTTIFYGGRGFGLFGELNRVELWGVVVGVWVLQLIWSPLWLSRFEMGPLEWVWRRLSYGKPVRM